LKWVVTNLDNLSPGDVSHLSEGEKAWVKRSWRSEYIFRLVFGFSRDMVNGKSRSKRLIQASMKKEAEEKKVKRWEKQERKQTKLEIGWGRGWVEEIRT
jgi:hypothetical protein